MVRDGDPPSGSSEVCPCPPAAYRTWELGQTCFGHHLLGHVVLTAEGWVCTICSFMQVPEVPHERGQTAEVGAVGLILPL